MLPGTGSRAEVGAGIPGSSTGLYGCAAAGGPGIGGPGGGGMLGGGPLRPKSSGGLQGKQTKRDVAELFTHFTTAPCGAMTAWRHRAAAVGCRLEAVPLVHRRPGCWQTAAKAAHVAAAPAAPAPPPAAVEVPARPAAKAAAATAPATHLELAASNRRWRPSGCRMRLADTKNFILNVRMP